MKMTLVGTGVRTTYLLHGLAARRDDLGLGEVVLHDTDHERLDVMSALGPYLCREWGAGFDVRDEPDPRAALSDARFVFAASASAKTRLGPASPWRSAPSPTCCARPP